MWVCVSDQDPKHLNIKAVLHKILESATQSKHENGELDWVQGKVRKELEGKRYLLVFDDVWIEDRDQCLKLGEFLLGGARGSRIVVTTRSKKTAKVIGSGSTYELQGLSNENSWRLFERLAFEQDQAVLDPDLVDIGKQIVKKCANVPLAIRTAGTLLYGKNKAEWQVIQRKGLGKLRRDGDNISHVLKLSYYHLDTRLKSCFSFCAIFLKDYVMDKLELIMLWMAQGYVQPLDEGQSIYDAGEEYFSILLRRCFFQDVKTDEYGEIMSCKMHDLMHDIAQEIAGDEICEAYSSIAKINEKVRHISRVKYDCLKSCLPQAKIRTCIEWKPTWELPSVDDIVRNWKYVRALDLHCARIEELPGAIGMLLHLRYLDLSYNYLKRLPEEITKLHNLQTLFLRGCCILREWPSDLSKLAKLRVLDIAECHALAYMPCGLNKLSGLCILPLFIAGAVKFTKKKQGFARLEDMSALDELRGKLAIEIYSNAKTSDKEGYLKKKAHLSSIDLKWLHVDYKNENKVVSDKVIAEELQPHPNLKNQLLYGYDDVEKPSWAIDDKFQTSLPNLVSLRIEYCMGLEDLPGLGRLRFLKLLKIVNLMNLEYMERGSSRSYGDEKSNDTILFPSLEKLHLKSLPKLKGWWRGDVDMGDDERSNTSISFPHLCELSIKKCPLLTSMPLCPTVEELELFDFSERLEIIKKNKIAEKRGGGVEDGDGQVIDMAASKLTRVYIDDIGYLKSLQLSVASQPLTEVWIRGNKKVENLREFEEVFRSYSSSLQSLRISYCKKMRSTSGALEYLTALQSLHLDIDDDIKNDEKMRCRLEREDEIPWSGLKSCLQHLHINYVPKGIRHLTSLHTLILGDCRRMKTIPEWITCLSSLQRFNICDPSQELVKMMQKSKSMAQNSTQYRLVHFSFTGKKDGI